MTKEIKLYGGSAIPIKEFSLDMMNANPTICFIAKRRSGKSWCIRDIINHFDCLPGGLIISKSEEMSGFFSLFFPDLFIFYEFKPEILENLFTRQRNIIEKCKYYYKRHKKVDPRSYLIMDDVLASKGTWAKDPRIAELFYNGRHYQLLFMLSMQFPLGIQPEFRANFEYVFLLAEDSASNLKRIHEHWASIFDSFHIFRQIFSQLTEDYGAMVLVAANAKKSLFDKIFYYKAKVVTINRKLGCRQFKQFHKDNYDKNFRNVKPMFDLTQLLPKNNKPNIQVKKLKQNETDDDDDKSKLKSRRR